jgi:hypothetical protein
MSTAPDGVDPSRYTDGRERYVNFAEDVLGLQLAETQKEILRALTEHERIVVVSGNGVGKSYTVAIVVLAYLSTNLDSTIMGTSGSYSQFVDAAWRPMKALHRRAKERVGLPGETRDGGQPELRIDDEWYAKIVSPRDPSELEGRHARNMMVVIEEADKPYIDERHFDSAGSTITDSNDRMLAVANPPEDEANIIYEKMEDDRWHTIQFSSFDSHNVKVDAGERDAEKIPGLVDLETIKEDWEAWNAEPWPGIEEARSAHKRRNDLDARWYRRRAGVIPPEAAGAHRPFTIDDVKDAWKRGGSVHQLDPATVEATGVDVARSGGDETIAATVHGDDVTIRYEEQGTDHVSQAEALTDELENDAGVPISVDAVGEGSGLADMLHQRFPAVVRFNAGGEPFDGGEFYDKWAEGLALLGQWLRDGGRIHDRKLREELLVAARTLEYEERHLASRGATGTDVLKLTSKSKLKERLGRSPDRLDAVYMAVWAGDVNDRLQSRRQQRDDDSGGAVTHL